VRQGVAIVSLTSRSEGKRGGKTIATKAIVDAALAQCPMVEHVLVLRRTGGKVNMKEGRDSWWDEECAKVPTYCPCEPMSAEDPLFILYVSEPRPVVAASADCPRPPALPASPRVSSTLPEATSSAR
jgi:acetyl-CoA synthetase